MQQKMSKIVILQETTSIIKLFHERKGSLLVEKLIVNNKFPGNRPILKVLLAIYNTNVFYL